MGLYNVYIEGDNFCVMKAFNKEWFISWEISIIMADILTDFQSFVSVDVVYYYREVNMTTDFFGEIWIFVRYPSDLVGLFFYIYGCNFG